MMKVLLLLLIFFSCGGVAVASSGEDESAISVFDTVSEIVNKISAAREWDPNQVRILSIDSENVKFTKATIYELDLQIGDHVLPAKFIDEVTKWQQLGILDTDTGDQRTRKRTKEALWSSQSLQSVLKPFQLNGPLELLLASSETFQGPTEEGEDLSNFRKVNLAVGSSVEVSGAQEVTLAHPVELSFPINKSSPIRSLAASILLLAAQTQTHGLQQDEDVSRLSLNITGPTLVASITGFDLTLQQSDQNLNVGSVKLLYKDEDEDDMPESDTGKEKGSIWPFPVLNSSDPRLSVLEDMLKAYIGFSRYKKPFAILHAKVAASTFVLFEFEIEREVNTTEELGAEAWPEWKTRPKVKRYNFQVLAKVQDNMLFPISVQSVRRYRSADTYAWRDVTSNISYTSFSTYLGPASPMTLDVY